MARRLLLAAFLMAGISGFAQQTGTETVMTTYRAKAGKEDEVLKALDQARVLMLSHKMVLPEPHLVLRGQDENQKTYFVEILTWVDHDAPDHAPAELTAVWNQLEAMCEKRDGHRGIEFPEVRVVRTK